MKPFSWTRFVNTNKRRKAIRSNISMEALESRMLLTADLTTIVDNFQADSEPGDDQHASEADATATELELDGTPLYSHIDSAGDVDVFQITPEVDGTLTLTGATLLPSDDSDDDMEDGHDECAPDSELGDDPHSETIGDATELEFDGDWATGWSYIDEAGDVDVFSFTADSTTTLDLFSMSFDSSNEEFVVEVLDADGEVVAESEWGFGSVDVEEGSEYFIRVSGSSDEATGEYYFEIVDCPGHGSTDDLESPFAPDSELGEDPHGDLFDDTATEIVSGGMGTALSSYVDAPGDEDVFRFTPEADADVSFHIWMSGDSDMWSFENVGVLELFDADGEAIDSADGGWGLFSAEVTGGEEYFVRVSGSDDATGFYNLSVQEFETIDLDMNDAFDWGEIDWVDWDSGWDDFSWEDFSWDSLDWGETTIDMFDIDATVSEGTTFGLDANFEVLNADGEVLGTVSEDGSVDIELTADETYYVRVSGMDADYTGTYVADMAFDEMETMEVELPETDETVTVTVNENRVVMRVGDEIVDRMKMKDAEKIMIVGTDSADDVIVRVNGSSEDLEKIEIDANRGNDRVRIMAKEDSFEGELRVEGDRGRDRLIARDSEIPVEMHGGGGSDVLTGSSENDILCGDGGEDEIRGRGGKDFVEGGNGDDKLMGGRGNDVMSGGLGNDMIDGQGGRDTLMESTDVDGVLITNSLEVADMIDELVRIERTYMDGAGDVDMSQFEGTVASDKVFARLMDELF